MADFINLVTITANVGSFFPFEEKLFNLWLENILKKVKNKTCDVFALHLQEFGNKHKYDPVECGVFLKKLHENFLSLFDNCVAFYDCDYNSPNLYTALCNIYFWKSSMKVSLFNYNTNVFEDFSSVDFNESLACNERKNYSKKIKFDLELFPYNKFSRKGFQLVRLRLKNQIQNIEKDITFVNIHLIHDIKFCYMEEPSIFANYRKQQFVFLLNKLNNLDVESAILAGDLNFRLCLATLIKELDPKYKKVDENDCIILMSSDNTKVITKIEDKKVFMNSLYLPNDTNINGYISSDTESSLIKDNINLYEFPLTFLPTYCFDSTNGSSCVYSSVRCPAYCDRIVLFGRNFINDVLKINGNAQDMYKCDFPETFIGDHLPILLSFKL